MGEYQSLIITVLLVLISAGVFFLILKSVKEKKEGADILKNIEEQSRKEDEINMRLVSLARSSDCVSEVLSRELSSSRQETGAAMERMTDKMTALTGSNLEQRNAMLKELQTGLEKINEANEKKLDKIRLTVDEKLSSTLGERLDSSFKTVSTQLEKLYVQLGEMKELSQGVTGNIDSLSRLLTNVKSRGTWAEYQLENILENTIPGMYVKNFKPSVGGVVEFAVEIPSGDTKSYMPIDSKFPMEDYSRLTASREAGDVSSQEEALKALEKCVIREAQKIEKYIDVPSTTPFAVMYLATEGLYAEIASSKNAIAEQVRSKYNVMIAGPSTMSALLSSVAMGFRAVNVGKRANEIRKTLDMVKNQHEFFAAALAGIKKKLGEADRSVDAAAKRNDIINKKLHRASLDADEEPGELRDNDSDNQP